MTYSRESTNLSINNMKRLLLLSFAALAMIVSAQKAKAQNIQLLYDTERECLTSTAELFRPDSFGSTYFFIDIDYNKQVTGVYWELARELCFWQDTDMSWLSAHLEYNGGMNRLTSFNNCWLAGATYSGHSEDFSKTWSLTASYKAIPGLTDAAGNKCMHNFQITGVWGIKFANGWCDFTGFFDFWKEERFWQNTKYIFISEPQLWVNLNKIDGWEKINLSVGGEVELSTNFVEKGFRAMPAFGAKWTF